jgi:hypothetical protein
MKQGFFALDNCAQFQTEAVKKTSWSLEEKVGSILLQEWVGQLDQLPWVSCPKLSQLSAQLVHGCKQASSGGLQSGLWPMARTGP